MEKEPELQIGSSLNLNVPDYSDAIAVIIGIEKYRYKDMPKVKYALNDVNEFEKILINGLKIPQDNIFKFTEEEASKTALETELKYTISQLGPHNKFIFYYAGHGFYESGGNRLTAYDSSIDFLLDTTISFKESILEPLKSSKCKHILMFIDSCAQYIIDNVRSRDIISDLKEKELNDFLLDATYNAVFFSCSPGQKSYSDDTLQHGIWSYFLFQALSGKDKKPLFNKNYLTDAGLKDYLKISVPDYISNNTNIRNPQIPYALIVADNTFAIQIFNDDSKIHLISGLGFTIKYDTIVLIDHELIGINKAKGFGRNHRTPDSYNGYTQAFVHKVFTEDVSDDLQEVYLNSRTLLNFDRTDINKVHDVNKGQIETPIFKYIISINQSKRNYSKALLVRNLIIKCKRSEIPTILDQTFPVLLRTIKLKIELIEDYNYNQIVDFFDKYKKANGGKVSDDDRYGIINYDAISGITISVHVNDKVLYLKTKLHISTSYYLDLIEKLLSSIFGTQITLSE